MLKKSLGFLTITGLVGSLAFAGCSATPATPSDGGSTDALLDTGAPTADAAKDAAKDVAKEAGPSCSLDQSAGKVLFAETSPPAKGQGLCTSKQVDDYHASCFSGNADAGDLCKSFTEAAANKGCYACLRSSADDKTKPTPAIFSVTATLVQANTLGCGYLVIGKPECAIPAINYLMCYRSVCGDCKKGSADETACQKEAKEGLCKQYEASKECQDAYTAGKTAIDAACGGTDFHAQYTKVANYMCGSPTDGGAGDAAPPTDAAADAASD